MNRPAPAPALALALASTLAIGATGCKRDTSSGGDGASAAPSSSTVVALPASGAANGPANARTLVFGDGPSREQITLSMGPVPASPLVVMLPKSWGSERELSPFASRLRETSPSLHTMVLPSAPLALSKPTDAAGAVLDDGAKAAAVARVRAIIKLADEALGAAPPLVLVGSDFGATLAVLVAHEEPRVIGAALLSPGPSLHGVDIYRPFSALMTKPVFLAACDRDPVSQEPMTALAAMARTNATSKRYAGLCHGAGAIALGSPVVRDDLAAFVERTTSSPSPSSSSAPDAAPSAPPATSGGTL